MLVKMPGSFLFPQETRQQKWRLQNAQKYSLVKKASRKMIHIPIPQKSQPRDENNENINLNINDLFSAIANPKNVLDFATVLRASVSHND